MLELPALRAPMNFVDGRLVGAFDEQFIDANVRRTAGGPDQCFGDVFGGEWNDAFVNPFRALGVAFESDDGELGFRHAWINRANPNPLEAPVMRPHLF